jgi:flagellar biosynthetic protein FlhB
VLWAGLEEAFGLARAPLGPAIADAAALLAIAFAAMAVAMLLIAAVDVPFQIWSFARQHRMSFAEVKRELRNEEGAPELRAKVRARQREIASRRMMEAVPSADVVITNPTHYACALAYDVADRRAAPRLVASGVDLVAWQIRTRAALHGVPIVESPLLARALYHSTGLGQEIPAGLYAAVAVVLRYAYRLRGKRGYEQAPEPPAELPIPSELVPGAGSRGADPRSSGPARTEGGGA